MVKSELNKDWSYEDFKKWLKEMNSTMKPKFDTTLFIPLRQDLFDKAVKKQLAKETIPYDIDAAHRRVCYENSEESRKIDEILHNTPKIEIPDEQNIANMEILFQKDDIIVNENTITDFKNTLAERKNDDKLCYSLVDVESIEGLIRVLEFGAKKYSPNNWQKGLTYTSIYDSLMRHMTAIMKGEDIDPKSGLPHIDHVGCNWMFLSWMMRNRKDMDNRNAK